MVASKNYFHLCILKIKNILRVDAHYDRHHSGAHGVAYDSGRGTGGDVTLYYDGKEIGKGRVDQPKASSSPPTRQRMRATNPAPPSARRHCPHQQGNGKINWRQIDLGEDTEETTNIDPDERFRIAMARQ